MIVENKLDLIDEVNCSHIELIEGTGSFDINFRIMPPVSGTHLLQSIKTVSENILEASLYEISYDKKSIVVLEDPINRCFKINFKYQDLTPIESWISRNA